MLLQTITKTYQLLTRKDKKWFFSLLPLMMVMSVVDVLGIALVMPFVAIVVDPNRINASKKIGWLYHLGHFNSTQAFSMVFGGVVLVTLVFGNLFSALGQWQLIKFSQSQAASLSTRLLERYLRQPYSFFLQHNATDLVKNVISEIEQVVANVFVQGLAALSKLIGIVFIVSLIFFVNYELAFIIIGVFGSAYCFLYLLARNQLKKINASKYQSSTNMFKIATESLSGIKELRLRGKEDVKSNEFELQALMKAKSIRSAHVTAQLPKYFLEILAFGGMVAIMLLLIAQNQSGTSIISTMALFAFAGYRLMPSLQILFSALVLIRTGNAPLDVIHKDLVIGKQAVLPVSPSAGRMRLSRKIQLQEISFCYPGSRRETLHDISLEIEANSMVAFVGHTGAGKSTIVDIILGLLTPSKGHLLADGKVLGAKDIRAWQNAIGYVPQQFFMGDSSIASNIAFGEGLNQIDSDKVITAAKLADIHSFIMDLPRGYDTHVGDRGVRLSGGQKQRIAIARALYHEPSILVLDEATSSLDNVTENTILDSIKTLAHSRTIIVVAHRLTTVQACDCIYMLKDGRIIAKGDYDTLYKSNSDFYKMASSGQSDKMALDISS